MKSKNQKAKTTKPVMARIEPGQYSKLKAIAKSNRRSISGELQFHIDKMLAS